MTVLPVKLVDDPYGTGLKVPFISLDHQLRNALAVWLRAVTDRDHEPINCQIWNDGHHILVEGVTDTAPLPIPPEQIRRSRFQYRTRRIDAKLTIHKARTVPTVELRRIYLECEERI